MNTPTVIARKKRTGFFIISCCECWFWVVVDVGCVRISGRDVFGENQTAVTYEGRVGVRLRRPSIFQQRFLKLVKSVM